MEQKFNVWVESSVRNLIKEKPVGAKYPDSVASVLGNNTSMLSRIAAIKDGHRTDPDILAAMPFSEAAQKYFGVELPKDYFDHFRGRST